jgi:hypothetical protein
MEVILLKSLKETLELKEKVVLKENDGLKETLS